MQATRDETPPDRVKQLNPIMGSDMLTALRKLDMIPEWTTDGVTIAIKRNGVVTFTVTAILTLDKLAELVAELKDPRAPDGH